MLAVHRRAFHFNSGKILCYERVKYRSDLINSLFNMKSLPRCARVKHLPQHHCLSMTVLCYQSRYPFWAIPSSQLFPWRFLSTAFDSGIRESISTHLCSISRKVKTKPCLKVVEIDLSELCSTIPSHLRWGRVMWSQLWDRSLIAITETFLASFSPERMNLVI